MERLTFRVSDDVARLICRIEKGACVGKPYTCPDTTPGCPEIQKVLNKLADYENTGLEPGEVAKLLRETISIKKELDEYTKAKREGRLLVLPCKGGERDGEIDSP